MTHLSSFQIFNSYRDNNINKAFNDSNNQAHSVATDPIHLKISSSSEIQGWPGKELAVSMQAADEFGNPTASIARSYFNTYRNSSDMVGRNIVK